MKATAMVMMLVLLVACGGGDPDEPIEQSEPKCLQWGGKSGTVCTEWQ